MEQSILWYDLETFGRNPFHDRIAQFASVRTNHRFEPIGEALVLYCRPSPDYLPDPQACLITGITPATCLEKGLPEYEFASRIFQEMMVPGTTVAGYNSIQFDDEFIRNLFYRNLFDPYLREYAKGNSRWDLINLVRATRDLRPGTMVWPRDPEGKPVFKLERLSEANGIGHDQAHDALSDVFATIELARRIQQENPRLFAWSFSRRKKDELRKLMDLSRRPALVHSAAYLTRPEGTTTLVCPLGVPGEDARQGRDTVICADLRHDPKDIMDLSVEEIQERVFLPSDREDEQHRRFPVYAIKLNRSPFLAPLNTLGQEQAKALGIDIDLCLRHREMLMKHKELSAKIRIVFNNPPASRLPADPDYQIYSGFFSDGDREQFALVHRSLEQMTSATEERRRQIIGELLSTLPRLNLKEKERVSKLITRIIGRSYAGYLGDRAASSWREFCQNRLIFPLLDEAMDLQKFKKELLSMMEKPGLELRQKIVLKELLTYFDEIERTTLEVK